MVAHAGGSGRGVVPVGWELHVGFVTSRVGECLAPSCLAVGNGDGGGLAARGDEGEYGAGVALAVVKADGVRGEGHPEVFSQGGFVETGGEFVGGYPGTDFIQIELLVIVVYQADGEAVGGAVNGVVGVHVACGALPLVGDREGDGVVGNEEGADVGGVGDGGSVGDESELHLGGVPTEVGTIDVE